jgi:MscS family membrane protein
MLSPHPNIQTASVRIRLSGLEQGWPVLEVCIYVLTRDGNEFPAIREDILLRLMNIVEDAGTGFTFPSQNVYLGRNPSIDKTKAEQVEAQVRVADQRQLPFPDFTPAEIAEIRDSLPYPAPESAVNRDNREEPHGNSPK